MTDLIVYTLENCPNCETLKRFLKDIGANDYVEHDMSSAESLTELRFNGVFETLAPVIRKDGNKFLTTGEMFSNGITNYELILVFVKGGKNVRES